MDEVEFLRVCPVSFYIVDFEADIRRDPFNILNGLNGLLGGVSTDQRGCMGLRSFPRICHRRMASALYIEIKSLNLRQLLDVGHLVIVNGPTIPLDYLSREDRRTHFHCPDTCTGANIQDTSRILNWSQI